jgi:MFS family permease
MAKRLPQAVLALGLVSLLTDLSSEMIYPLLPVFLSTVLGAGAVALGIIEGVAESTAALLKVASGIWTDRSRRRKLPILAGYGLAGLVRPLIGLAGGWGFVLAMRFLDRAGKGIRSAPRDALIADVTEEGSRGRAFGFHRSMDHAGAVLGPLVAAGLLALGAFSLRHVFLLAAVPAALVVVVIAAAVREPAAAAAGGAPPAGLQVWRQLGKGYRRFLAALVVFTLGNSTDAFLLLSLSQAGVPPPWIAVLWSAHHVVKMAGTWFGGLLADRWGPRRLILSGWILYAAVYAAFAVSAGAGARTVLFLVYGLYYGLTEPAEKAWVARLVAPELRGTAFGFYHAAVGAAALPASLLFGVIMQEMGAAAAFATGAALAAVAAGMIIITNYE